jgi:hypothetical protein
LATSNSSFATDNRGSILERVKSRGFAPLSPVLPHERKTIAIAVPYIIASHYPPGTLPDLVGVIIASDLQTDFSPGSTTSVNQTTRYLSQSNSMG